MTNIVCSFFFEGDVAFGSVKTQVWTSWLIVAGSLKGHQSGMDFTFIMSICIKVVCSVNMVHTLAHNTYV